MRALFYSLLGYFLTPWGLVLMGVLDSSLVFFLPLGIDFVVILLAARKPELFWLYAVLATVGSVAGASVTFWIGRKVGEHGLSRLIKPSRLKRIEQRVSERAAVSVAALAIIPPPFPFTAFVLTSGAFKGNPWSFLITLAGGLAVLRDWLTRWRARCDRESSDAATRAQSMRRVNPIYIPRNERVEEALAAATDHADYAPFEALLAVIERPFEERAGLERYAEPAPAQVTANYQTFCGT